ncbi:MAG TPA: hypothetical protein VFS02_05350 [Telluria sp.]|nr:hypothetical protein [Telluria sp.]
MNGCRELAPASRHTLWRRLSCIFVVAGTLWATGAASQGVIWIGRPTVADYMAYNLREGMEQFGKLSQQMAQFGAEIDEARRAYFAAPASNRAAAGDKFGELLFQKDLLIAMGRVSVTNEKDDLASLLMALANGGRPPDGGIPPVARHAFSHWVSAIRASAGPGFGGMPNPMGVAIAMKNSASLKEYEEYRRLRDQAEWDEYEATRNGGVRKLLAPGRLVSPKTYFGESVMAQGFDGRIARLPNKILQCEYAGRQAEGSVFHFWHNQAPEEIGLLMAMQMHAFDGLKDHVAAECPADSKLASALASSPVKVSITPQMYRDAKQQRNTRVLDPAEARIVDERNAAARQKAEERKSLQEKKAAMFRACNDDLRAASMVGRRDRYAMQAAHAQYAQCINAARGQ